MLEKKFNFYAVDDVFDEKFACDFRLQRLEEKYKNSDTPVEVIEYNMFDYGNPKFKEWIENRIEGKRLRFYQKNNIDLNKIYSADEAVKIFDMYKPGEEEKMLLEYQAKCMEQMMQSYEQSYMAKEKENFFEEGNDDEYNLHDRSVDYDYDYENDCEYDGDEEIFGYGN